LLPVCYHSYAERAGIVLGLVLSVGLLGRPECGIDFGNCILLHSGQVKRPQFDALHKAATRREFDVVMAWSVDRLGRSLQDLIGFLSEINAVGVDLFLHQQGLDTTTPGGKAMFQMLGVFAEFERSMIQERVRAGLARAKSEGKQLGRPRIAP
jgi:DNA invertase Pin-like site-specific DNA recombinase